MISPLSSTYNNIGAVYHALKDEGNALISYQAALDCQLAAGEPDVNAMIVYYHNIASVHQALGNNDEALDNYHKALELQKQFLGENDPTIADTYRAMAQLYDGVRNFQQACELLSC